MAELGYRLFDADNHYYEAEDAFIRHVDRAMQKRCMQWAEIGGRKRLLVAGKVNRFIPNPTFDPVARPGCLDDYYRGRNPEGKTVPELFGALEPINPAYRDRDARLEVMGTQGLERALLFPTLGVGMEESLRHDPEACIAAFRGFNRWLDEDWGFSYKDRLYAAPYITLIDVDAAVRELAWALERDARWVVMRAAPVPAEGGSCSLADPAYDPYWSLVNETGVVVAFHGGDQGYEPYARAWGEGGEFMSFRTTPLRGLVMGDRAPFDTFAAILCHGLLDRFPNLRLASIEMGAEWLTPLLHKLDKTYRQMPYAFKQNPVEAFRRHVWVSPFQEENVKALGDLIGADRLLMGSDWPHAEGIEEPADYVRDLGGFTPDEVRRIMRENALELVERRSA